MASSHTATAGRSLVQQGAPSSSNAGPRAGTYPSLFRRALLPALDVVNRTQIASVLASLERSQWWTREDLEQYQSKKLADILEWTKRHCTFYREFWASAPRHRQAASCHEALDGLPIITKSELREASTAGSFPVRDYRGRVSRVSTSGSTGQPMVYLRSAEQESWSWALRMRMWQWAGYQPGDRYLTLNLNARSKARSKSRDLLFRGYHHSFDASNAAVERVLHDLERHRIANLIGYASSLHLLSNTLRSRNFENPGVRAVLSTGDTLFPHYRSIIEETFGTKVLDYYSAGGEGLHLASQCEACNEYHLHIENSVIEIIRDGRPAVAGEEGEIVVTQLDNRAMPLIRYATQDIAVASEDNSCRCKRELPLLHSIEGRVADIVQAPNGSWLVVHFFTILLEHTPGVMQFQVVQRELDRILVRIVPHPPFNQDAVERQIRDAVARATNDSLGVDFEFCEDIPVAQSMKRRFVISELEPSIF